MRLLGLTVMLFALALSSCAEREIANSNAKALASQQSIKGQALPSCINLNLATAEQLMQLPGIGEVMSQRIIEYRKRHGPFRRPEEIIIIEGFSERKYRAVADQICVE
jgi:competence protein ComEA